MIPPPSFSCTLASRSPLLSSPKRLQKPLQRSLTGLGRAGRPLPLPTAHLPAHRPEPRPCGRCRLRGSSRRSQTPTPDTGASECPLGPSPTLCVIHVLGPVFLNIKRETSAEDGDSKCPLLIPPNWGFPGGSVVKNLPANSGDARDVDSIPGLGRSPGVGNGNPLQYSCLENSTGRGGW